MDRVDVKFARAAAQPMDRANRTRRARCECRLRRRERLSGRGRSTDAGAYVRRREDLDEYYRRPSGERPGGSNPRRSGKSETALCGHAFRRVRLFRPGGALGPGCDLPPVRVDDLQIHPRTFDLVIATHGRSIYVLDDARPFRELTPEIASKPAHFFSVRPVNGAYAPSGFSEWNGKGVYRGANPAEGALFTVWVRDLTGDEIKIVLTNATGVPVAKLNEPGG